MNTSPTQVAANPLVINQNLVAANGNSAKVTVCHNGQALEVNQTALASHLAHGDNQGVCNNTTSGGNS